MIKIVELVELVDWALVRQICAGIAAALVAVESQAAGPIALECEASVRALNPGVIGETRIESFVLNIQSDVKRSKILVSGKTSIELDVNEIDQSATTNNRYQQRVELNKTVLYVEKIIREVQATDIQVLRIEIPTGKLRYDSWSSLNTWLVAEGMCK